MDVTRKNFKETLSLIDDSIKKADFLSLDTEFTGLINGREVSIFDLPQEYYLKLRNGCSDFLLIQFGLCAFYWDKENEHYLNDTYNFYLFPREKPGPDKTFVCLSSSLEFLAAQGFDFNKLIREGISYMSGPTEERLRENLIERQKTYTEERKDNIIIPNENKQQIEEICERVQIFLDKNNTDDMEIDKCNAFVRLLLFQELERKFKDKVYLETVVLENKNRILKVSRVTENTLKNKTQQRKEKEWNEFEDAVGFSKVAKMISQSGKLVIGHNMVLDVIHTLNHFFQPLPADFNEFKEFAHCAFPWLLDTKYMASTPQFKDKINSTVLQQLLQTLSEPPFTLPKAGSQQGRGYCHTEEKHHEAGYDAYITGLCFLSMLEYQTGDKRVTSPSSPVLKPYVNKLYLAKTAYQDCPYINLVGSEPTPSRDHVFHLKFPKEWQRNDINQLFSVFGQITVMFIDDTSALVALSRREQSKDVMRIIKSSKISIMPYSKYLAMMNKYPETRWRKPESEIDPACMSPVATAAITTNRQAESRKVPPRKRLSNSNIADNNVTSRRTRSASFNAASPDSIPSNRKRNSSGVFQIENEEPQPKKAEITITDVTKKRLDQSKKKEKTTAPTPQGGVGSFKESDCWD